MWSAAGPEQEVGAGHSPLAGRPRQMHSQETGTCSGDVSTYNVHPNTGSVMDCGLSGRPGPVRSITAEMRSVAVGSAVAEIHGPHWRADKDVAGECEGPCPRR
jgi:hypothetical protein